MKAIAIVGPTASGKTTISIELAKLLGGEILCCDSMQIYKEMDIGTAKPTKEEQIAIPHHLFDLIHPTQSFSSADYAIEAKSVLQDLQRRNVLPIFCGGTGLYLDSIRTLRHEGLVPGASEEIRAKLEEIAKTDTGKMDLYNRLREIDPKSAESTHPNNTRRVIRALEIYELTGITKTELDKQSSYKNPDLDLFIIGLRYDDKSILANRIEKRIDLMLESGLLEETKKLLDAGIFEKSPTAKGAIGYKEFLPYLMGETTFESAKQDLYFATKHYAKRQMTYFNKMDGIHWISMDTSSNLKSKEEVLGEILSLIQPFLHTKESK